MTLERVVAAPYQHAGTRQLTKQEFVVALSLHRDWFSPAQAKQVVERATAEGLVTTSPEGLTIAFDPSEVRVPSGFAPDDSVLARRSTFETILSRCVDAGYEKREIVAEINQAQARLGLTVQAAAALYATRIGVDVSDEIDQALDELRA